MRPLVALGWIFLMSLSPAAATQSTISLSGHLWETGGFPPSFPGDELQAVGVIHGIGAPLFWSPDIYAYTWYAHGLISVGSVVIGDSHVTRYVGGEISVHVDRRPSNHSYGTFPENPTVPSTFTDGHAVYLRGRFASCAVALHRGTGSGSFAGRILFTAGNAYPQLQNPSAWSMGSTITGDTPAGYAGQVNGTLYVDGPTALPGSSWAKVKSMYR